VIKIQEAAYKRLQSIAQIAANPSEDELLTYGISQLEQQRQRMREADAAAYAYRWDAVIVQVSSLVVLLSAALLLMSVVAKLVQRWFSNAPLRRFRSVLSASGSVGAFGLLLGSVTLYVSYQPYAEAFSAFMAKSGAEQLRLLDIFLALPHAGFMAFPFLESPFLDVYLWCAFIAVSSTALVFAATRLLRKGPRLHQAA